MVGCVGCFEYDMYMLEWRLLWCLETPFGLYMIWSWNGILKWRFWPFRQERIDTLAYVSILGQLNLFNRQIECQFGISSKIWYWYFLEGISTYQLSIHTYPLNFVILQISPTSFSDFKIKLLYVQFTLILECIYILLLFDLIQLIIICWNVE